jgi:hypothetical protein
MRELGGLKGPRSSLSRDFDAQIDRLSGYRRPIEPEIA